MTAPGRTPSPIELEGLNARRLVQLVWECDDVIAELRASAKPDSREIKRLTKERSRIVAELTGLGFRSSS